ncbi:TIGR02710 family CRISPR-associated protein, partial [bacterium]|nr:TIGR02710 family CRISPR-associated protein [bacterium]
MKILFLTVGGSPEPLITSINSLKPDLCVFVCSEDSNTREGSYVLLPEILMKTGEITHETILVRPDDPEDCISKIISKVEEVKKRYPNAKMLADYTGGTKTMCAALFWVATHKALDICLTTGIRRNLIAVVGGETTRKIPLSFPYYEELHSTVDFLLENFHYTSAEELIRAVLSKHEFSSEIQDDLQKKFEIIGIFRLWDAYDSLGAFKKAQPYRKELWQDYLCFWDKVIGDRIKMEKEFKEEVEQERISISHKDAPIKYAVVQDLLLNAERCEVRGRYDEATARLYRALEALAQLRLKSEYGIDTSDVDVGLLPERLREHYESRRKEGKIRLGLVDAYELLNELDDVIGKAFKLKEGELREVLRKRNQSTLAHGFKSISEDEYKGIREVMEGFIKECLKE